MVPSEVFDNEIVTLTLDIETVLITGEQPVIDLWIPTNLFQYFESGFYDLGGGFLYEMPGAFAPRLAPSNTSDHPIACANAASRSCPPGPTPVPGCFIPVANGYDAYSFAFPQSELLPTTGAISFSLRLQTVSPAAGVAESIFVRPMFAGGTDFNEFSPCNDPPVLGDAADNVEGMAFELGGQGSTTRFSFAISASDTSADNDGSGNGGDYGPGDGNEIRFCGDLALAVRNRKERKTSQFFLNIFRH